MFSGAQIMPDFMRNGGITAGRQDEVVVIHQTLDLAGDILAAADVQMVVIDTP